MTLYYILLFTFISTALSLFLVAILLLHKRLVQKISFQLVSFAAGALLATGFTDTLPEAVKKTELSYIITTVCIAVFFVIEKAFLSFHHHEAEATKNTRFPTSFLIFGDVLHNFIDGVSIAATFIVSFPLGLITSIAVFVHEIPHELGDFGILLHAGFSRSRVLYINIATGLAAFGGAIIGFFLSEKLAWILPILLSITTANFLYLALSDLLPEIHDKSKGKQAIVHSISFILGISFVVILGSLVRE